MFVMRSRFVGLLAIILLLLTVSLACSSETDPVKAQPSVSAKETERGESHSTPSEPNLTAARPSFGPGDTGDRKPQSTPIEPNLPDDERSQALIARLKARWAAMVERDFKQVYTFETPEYREQYDFNQFGGQFGGMVTWHGIEPLTIDYVDDHAAEVSFLLDHSFTIPGSEHVVRRKGLIQERWIEDSGEWWHQSQ